MTCLLVQNSVEKGFQRNPTISEGYRHLTRFFKNREGNLLEISAETGCCRVTVFVGGGACNENYSVPSWVYLMDQTLNSDGTMPRHISEKLRRKEMIELQLQRAGWDLHEHAGEPVKVKNEIPLEGYDPRPWNGLSDYCLYRENGEVLAIVEAKGASIDLDLAQTQLGYYVTEIEKRQSFRPFGFLANGNDIYFVDVDIPAKRAVAGFFTRQELENLLF